MNIAELRMANNPYRVINIYANNFATDFSKTDDKDTLSANSNIYQPKSNNKPNYTRCDEDVDYI